MYPNGQVTLKIQSDIVPFLDPQQGQALSRITMGVRSHHQPGLDFILGLGGFEPVQSEPAPADFLLGDRFVQRTPLRQRTMRYRLWSARDSNPGRQGFGAAYFSSLTFQHHLMSLAYLRSEIHERAQDRGFVDYRILTALVGEDSLDPYEIGDCETVSHHDLVMIACPTERRAAVVSARLDELAGNAIDEMAACRWAA